MGRKCVCCSWLWQCRRLRYLIGAWAVLKVWSAKKADSFLINFFVVVDFAFIPPCLRWQPGGAMPASQAELRHWRRGSGCPLSYYLQALYPAQVCSNHPGQDHGSPAEYSSMGGRDNSEQGYSSVRPQPDPASGLWRSHWWTTWGSAYQASVRLPKTKQRPWLTAVCTREIPGWPRINRPSGEIQQYQSKIQHAPHTAAPRVFFFFLFFFLSYLSFLSVYCFVPLSLFVFYIFNFSSFPFICFLF